MSESSKKTREVPVTAVPSLVSIEIGVNHILMARSTDITVEEYSSIDEDYFSVGVILAGDSAQIANSSTNGKVRLTGFGDGSLMITRLRLEDI